MAASVTQAKQQDTKDTKDQKLDPKRIDPKTGKPQRIAKSAQQQKKQELNAVAVAKQKEILNQSFSDQKEGEKTEARIKREQAKNKDQEEGLESDKIVSELDLAAAEQNQTLKPVDDLEELVAQTFAGKGDSGDSGGDNDADIDSSQDFDQETGMDQGTGVSNVAELSSAMESLSMVEGMDRKELLELIGLTKEYFKQLLERNPEEMRQAHAAIQSAVAIYLTQLLTELSESDSELDEEEEMEGNKIRSGIKSSLEDTARQLNELSGQVNAQNQKRSKKKKSKYLANLYEVPLLKALMKGDSFKRQSVWKALDKHLESQIEKEDVREEMFKYSF